MVAKIIYYAPFHTGIINIVEQIVVVLCFIAQTNSSQRDQQFSSEAVKHSNGEYNCDRDERCEVA